MTPREASDYHRQLVPVVRAVVARYRTGLGREDAEEMAADATVAALRAAEAFDPEHPAGASLTTLATRYADLAARLWLRRRNHGQQDDVLSLDDADDDGRSLVDKIADDRAADLDAEVERGRRVALVREIVESLPPGQRRAILGTLDGRSVPEIASPAGVSRGAVYEAYDRGLSAVRREIGRRERRQAAEAAYRRVME